MTNHEIIIIFPPLRNVVGVVGVLLLLIGGWWLYKIMEKRKSIELKQKFFRQNGGLLLQQQLSSSDQGISKTKVFSSKELETATDGFNVNRILGQGGQGTVYKGMLADGGVDPAQDWERTSSTLERIRSWCAPLNFLQGRRSPLVSLT